MDLIVNLVVSLRVVLIDSMRRLVLSLMLVGRIAVEVSIAQLRSNGLRYSNIDKTSGRRRKRRRHHLCLQLGPNIRGRTRRLVDRCLVGGFGAVVDDRCLALERNSLLHFEVLL